MRLHFFNSAVIANTKLDYSQLIQRRYLKHFFRRYFSRKINLVQLGISFPIKVFFLIWG